MIKLKDILTEVATDKTWNSQLWNSNTWMSDIWMSHLWNSNLWNSDLGKYDTWKSDTWKSDVWNPEREKKVIQSEVEHKSHEIEALPGIFVDPSIVRHIKILNNIGFPTTYSCSGISYDHPHDTKKLRKGYVAFKPGLSVNQITRIYRATFNIKEVVYTTHFGLYPVVRFGGNDFEKLDGWNQFIKNMVRHNLPYRKSVKEQKNENPRRGRCYELSGRYVSVHPDTILVHGKIVNPIERKGLLKEIEHAWVEEGNEIFDPCMDVRWPKQIYESFFKAKPYKKYTHDEVNKISLKTRHWGPWEV